MSVTVGMSTDLYNDTVSTSKTSKTSPKAIKSTRSAVSTSPLSSTSVPPTPLPSSSPIRPTSTRERVLKGGEPIPPNTQNSLPLPTNLLNHSHLHQKPSNSQYSPRKSPIKSPIKSDNQSELSSSLSPLKHTDYTPSDTNNPGTNNSDFNHLDFNNLNLSNSDLDNPDINNVDMNKLDLDTDMERTQKTLLLARLRIAESTASSLKVENDILRQARDKLLQDNGVLNDRCGCITTEALGYQSRAVYGETENSTLQNSLQMLEREKDGALSALSVAEHRREEQEVLLQEAWVRLSALAKKEAATMLRNDQLEKEILKASSKGNTATAKLSSCQGKEAELTSRLEGMRVQLTDLQSVLQERTLSALKHEDQIRDLNAQNKALAAGSKDLSAGLTNESERLIKTKKVLAVIKNKLQDRESDLTINKAENVQNLKEISNMTDELATLNMNFDSLTEKYKDSKRELEDTKDKLAEEQERASDLERVLEDTRDKLSEEQERASDLKQVIEEWKDRFHKEEEDKETAISKHNEMQAKLKEDMEAASTAHDEIQTNLKAQLEENILRGDTAAGELLKHKELISMINKLSAEGEAGRLKARRISMEARRISGGGGN
jgi:chromosome segregation ATPase